MIMLYWDFTMHHDKIMHNELKNLIHNADIEVFHPYLIFVDNQVNLNLQ